MLCGQGVPQAEGHLCFCGERVRLEITLKLNYGTLILILFVAVVFGWRASMLVWTPYRIVGLAIAIPSFVLLILARVQLGRAFSVQAKASTLITTGIYSRIRNPIYVFSAVMIAGIIIWTGKPWLFLALAALVAMQVYRAQKEGRVLEEKFGEAYREYKKKTWF
jgi:protein-S-isoprenylcysteine O-methyltransferase Ste14